MGNFSDLDLLDMEALHRTLTFFADFDFSLSYLTAFLGKSAALIYIVVSLATTIKLHHWQLRQLTSSVPSTFISNATRKSSVWVKLHYSSHPLPTELVKNRSTKAVKSHEFRCVEPGEVIKLQMTKYSLNLFITVFVGDDTAETVKPIAILHPIDICQSFIVTKDETITLMSDDNPNVDSEGVHHDIARSVISRQFINDNRRTVSNTMRKGFWSLFDWCLWRLNSGIFSSRPKLLIENHSDDVIWVRCGLRSMQELCLHDESLACKAACGMTRIAPGTRIPFHLYFEVNGEGETPELRVDIYRRKRLRKKFELVQSEVVPINQVHAIYSDDNLMTYDEQKHTVVKKKKKDVKFDLGEKIDVNSDSEDINDLHEDEEESDGEKPAVPDNDWIRETYWSPYAQTHVANAADNPIWVSCLTDEQECKIQNEDLKNSFLKGEFNIVKQLRFTKIIAHDFLRFEPVITNHPACRVFITVMLEREDGQLEIIASNFAAYPNYSIIVARDLQIRRTMMGKIWRDEQCFKHDIWAAGDN